MIDKFVQFPSALTPYSIKQFIVDTYEKLSSKRKDTMLGIHAALGNHLSFNFKYTH